VPAKPSDDSLPFDERVLRELTALDAPVAAAAWRQAHADDHPLLPGEEADFGSGLGPPLEGTWCLATVRRELSAQGSLVRTAYFYPPELPLPARFSDSAKGDPGERCTLGLVEVELEVGNVSEGREVVSQVQRRLSRRFGPGLSGEWYPRWEPNDLEPRVRWAGDGTTVFLGLDDVPHRVRVLAWLPSSGVDFRSEGVGPSLGGTSLARAVAAAGGLDSAAAAPLIGLYDRALAAALREDRAAWSDSELIAVLRDWVPAARRLSDRKRAAGLLLADLMVNARSQLSGWSREEATGVQDSVHALGAEFDRWPITGDTGYVRNWLWEALRTDSAGPVSELAAVLLLAQGWDTHLACGGGSELFLNVMREGESWLPRLRSSRHQALAHLYVARAYGDIVALAEGIGELSAYFDAERYRPRAAEARTAASTHYRGALQLLPASAERRQVEQEAWRLAVGLAPLRTWFTCVYD
jgi:hypothetical protein